MQTTTDDFLGGKVRLIQDTNGYRATSDAILVASAVRAKPEESILDVGCGTGIILYCLNARVKHLKLTGIELQPDLYQLANQNAKLNQCDVQLYCEDIFKTKSVLHGQQFHHVVSNPPFYTENLIRKHPQTATAYHQTVDLSKWISFCLKHIRAKGTFTMIHRIEALPEILSILKDSSLGALEIFPIYSKQGQSAKRVIIRGILGSKKPFVLQEGLIMHCLDNTRTDIAEKIMRFGKSIA